MVSTISELNKVTTISINCLLQFSYICIITIYNIDQPQMTVITFNTIGKHPIIMVITT